MTRFFSRATLIAALSPLAVAVTPVAAVAEGVFVSPPPNVVNAGPPLRGPRANIAFELRRFGYGDVDVRSLSNGQVAQINHLIHSGRSDGDIRGLIGATLRRRGFLQRTADRIYQ